jgi:hypothetical protein
MSQSAPLTFVPISTAAPPTSTLSATACPDDDDDGALMYDAAPPVHAGETAEQCFYREQLLDEQQQTQYEQQAHSMYMQQMQWQLSLMHQTMHQYNEYVLRQSQQRATQQRATHSEKRVDELEAILEALPRIATQRRQPHPQQQRA